MLDSALRHKLGYDTLPEPAVYQSAAIRAAWAAHKFVSRPSVCNSSLTSGCFHINGVLQVKRESILKAVLACFLNVV